MTPAPSPPPRPVDEIFADIGGQPNSCTHREYHALARHLLHLAPCRFLVFGVGRDSAAWNELNAHGTTLFLENNPDWIAKVASHLDPRAILPVEYQQPFEAWEEAGFAPDQVLLPPLPPAVLDLPWDLAFVDAPWGPTFGRHQSTLAATRALAPGRVLALHDCDRQREQAICRILLEARGFSLLEEVERLRLYRAPA